MYIEKKNKKALESQSLIASALLTLFSRKPFQQITVTELCRQAGVGRKTFYRHFETREDVIELILDQMCQDYKEKLSCLPKQRYMHHHFEYVRDHARFFIDLYQNGLTELVREKFSVLLAYTMPKWSDDPMVQEYQSAYIIAGVEAVQSVWIRRGCSETIEEVVKLAFQAQMQLGDIM